jgi:hypothetical protein
MTRPAETILQNNIAWASGRQNPMVDLRFGGQMGFAPDLTQYVSNQSYVQRNLICLLVEAPRGFSMMPNGDKWVATLRSLVELHPLSIDGLQAGLEVTVEDTAPVGGGGQMHQDFTDVKMARSNPVFRWTEKYGMPISSFFRAWITYLMMDPDSKVANIATLAGVTRPGDMLADMYSATMAFIEPDPTHTKVVKSWLCTNMFPQGTGEITGRRELTAAGEAKTYDINFTAISQFGLGVDKFCQSLLDSINITNANPYTRPAFVQGITADVQAVTEGYRAGVSNLSNTAIRV